MNSPKTAQSCRPLVSLYRKSIVSLLVLLTTASCLLFLNACATTDTTDTTAATPTSHGARAVASPAKTGIGNHWHNYPLHAPDLTSLTAEVPGLPADSALPHSRPPIKMSGGCWTYNTSSPDATVESNGQPQMYGFDGSDAPMLGLSFDTCNDLIQVTMDPSGYDYYKVDWWRPGRDGWTQFTTSNSVVNFTNAWYNTQYEFTVDACTSHWYGDSCTSWSPRVYINS